MGGGSSEPGHHIAGAPCKLKNCGVSDDLWKDNPTGKVTLPGGVRDYFYKYESLPAADMDTSAYYGTKVRCSRTT